MRFSAAFHSLFGLLVSSSAFSKHAHAIHIDEELPSTTSTTTQYHRRRELQGGKKSKSCPGRGSLNIIMTNDDGFDAPNIQALFRALRAAGHNVAMAAPYASATAASATVTNLFRPYTSGGKYNESELGKTTRNSACGTLRTGSEPIGNTTIEPGQYYLWDNPANCVFFGLDVVARKEFNGKPADLVVSGPNFGTNYGYLSVHSGTVGAVVTAMNRFVPGIAFNADNGDFDSACRPTQSNPELIAAISLRLIDQYTCGNKTTIAPGTGLNVNIPTTANRTLADLNKFKFVESIVGTASTFGYKFVEELADCEVAVAGQARINRTIPRGLPGLCVTDPYDQDNYPTDNNPLSEYNVVMGDPTFYTVSVSTLQRNNQAYPLPKAPKTQKSTPKKSSSSASASSVATAASATTTSTSDVTADWTADSRPPEDLGATIDSIGTGTAQSQTNAQTGTTTTTTTTTTNSPPTRTRRLRAR